jgi:hypothetical protein
LRIVFGEFSKKLYFKFTTDEKGLWLWSDENHKLFFSEEVLSVEKNELEKAVAIFPNPAKNSLNIEIKSTSIPISNVLILDFQGRIIIQKIADFNKVDISKLATGIYFVKIMSNNNSSITEKLVKK